MLVNAPKRIAPDVAWHPVGYVNVYFIGRPGGDWVLVDTGTPGHAAEVRAAAVARFGSVKPRAILLTHGHFDHSGNAAELAGDWNIPVYAHRLELPFLTRFSPYPPPDPLMGGFVGIASIFFPSRVPDLSGCVKELPEQLPWLPDWEWIPTPGHSPGHISLIRRSDGTLIAGDAVATTKMDSLRAVLRTHPELSGGVTPFHCDWKAAVASVQRLAELNPQTIAAGHGEPMSGPELATRIAEFAEDFAPPERGRYVSEPARTDETGVLWLPPRAPFAWLRVAWRALAAGAGTIGALVAGILMLTRRRRAHR